MATGAVIDFFEHLSDGWLYDASHLRKLWAALHKDRDAAGAQLAKCLLIYIGAPEKHESDKVIPRCMKEWAGLAPTDPWGEDVIGSLLGQLAEWMPLAAKHSRVRVLDLIVSILRGLRQETSLEDSVRVAVVESLREHLADKDDKVRQLAVIALTKLGFPEMEVGNDDVLVSELLAELTDALHCDISQDVRSELVNRLPLDNSTLLEVLRHQSDRSAKVAASVYDRVARDVPMVQSAAEEGVAASAEQRISLLWYGLNEARSEVRKAAQGLLTKWFLEGASQDVVALVDAIDPKANAELCQLVMEQLVAHSHWDPQAWLKAETAVSRSLPDLVRIAEQFEEQQQTQQARYGAASGSGGADSSGDACEASWLAAVRPALAFVWVYATRKVAEVATDKGRVAAEKVAAVVALVEASGGAQAEMVLEAFLPTAQQMAKLCRLAAEAGPSYRYITTQLLEIATLSYMNWVDASSRCAAEEALRSLITRISRPTPDGAGTAGCAVRDPFLPASSGGNSAWEAAVLRFAAAVFGSDRMGLVHSVLPMVLQLSEEGEAPGRNGRIEDAAEGPLLQALTFLHLLMAAAGPTVLPSTAVSVPPPDPGAAGSSSGGNWTLAQAVDRLAWTANGHISPVVRAAAVRCAVELCLRNGGAVHLSRTVAMLSPLLPTAAASGGAAYEDDDRDFSALQQLPRRVALQGLIDLSLTWGEPTLTAELRKAVAAAADRRHVDELAAKLATLGVHGVEGSGQGPAGAAAAAVTAAGIQVPGVVQILLRLTEAAVRKLQSSDGYLAARGIVADALLGAARLVYGWSFQLRLNKRLRHQVVTAMQPRLAEQLLTRLLLARFSPAVESEPWLRSQLLEFFKSFQASASEPSEEGAVHRSMLAGSFLHAARCAMALPAPTGAPATARGCAAPALMEFMGELLASAAAAAITTTSEAVEDTADDAGPGEDRQHQGATTATVVGADAAAAPGAASEVGNPDALVWLCEMVLEEVVRLGSPGSASLDTSEGRVRAYAAEMCKMPMRLLPGLPIIAKISTPAELATIRRLAYLGRRAALTAGETLVKTVVPDTAYKKLQEFVRCLEELQQVKTAPLSEEDGRAFLQALREQMKDRLEELPSLEDVTADLEPDNEWDALTADAFKDAAGATICHGADQGRAKKRVTAAKGAKTKARGGATARTRQTSKTSRATVARSQRSDTRIADDTGSTSDSDGDDDTGFDDDSESDDGHGRAASANTAGKAARGRARIATASTHQATSQVTATASDVCTQPGRRPVRAAAAKASQKLEALRATGDTQSRLAHR